jgi:hypothetical protein
VITVRALAKLIGNLISSIEGVDAARIMVVELQLLRSHLTKDPEWEWDRQLPVHRLDRTLVKEALKGCESWTEGYEPMTAHRIHWNGKLMYSEPPRAVVYTDACQWQRGVWVQADGIHKAIDRALPFVEREMEDHIRLQETAAAADGAVETVLERDYSSCVIVAKIDATAAVKYIKCMGGRMASFTKRIVDMQQMLRARHMPTRGRSGQPGGRIEQTLARGLYAALVARWGPFGLDACAASWNAQEDSGASRGRGAIRKRWGTTYYRTRCSRNRKWCACTRRCTGYWH